MAIKIEVFTILPSSWW